MYGRYGSDQLNLAMLVCSLILMLLSQLTRLGILWWLAFALLVCCYLRIFSRNIPKRYEENQKFLRVFWPLLSKLRTFHADMKDSRTHCHMKCPSCGQKIRVPRGRGKISITCPRCANQFVRKT